MDHTSSRSLGKQRSDDFVGLRDARRIELIETVVNFVDLGGVVVLLAECLWERTPWVGQNFFELLVSEVAVVGREELHTFSSIRIDFCPVDLNTKLPDPKSLNGDVADDKPLVLMQHKRMLSIVSL